MALTFKRLWLACVLWLAPPALAQVADPASSPAFDCAKARGRVEKMICAEPALAASDRRVAEIYGIAQTQVVDPADLKRQQRRWLSDRDDCKDVSCVENSYAQRLTELGTLTGRFAPTETAALCGKLVDPETRATTLATTTGTEDINNDGRPDRATQCYGGTANVPCVEYADADGKPLPILPDGFQWVTYGTYGRSPFRADGRTLIYHALDETLEQPAYVSYVTPTNREVRICDFETTVASAVVEGGEDVCAAIESADERVELLELTPLTEPNTYAVDRRDTKARALGNIDIDNDGLEERVVEYVYSSDAARGCETNYFELVAEDGKSLATNSNSAAIRQLQGLGEDGADSRSCGLIRNRLIRFGDKIYFESNAANATGVPHELRILRGEAVAPVCSFEREVRTRIKTLY